MDAFVQTHEVTIRLGCFVGALARMAILPFRGGVTGYAVHRRRWAQGEADDD